MSRMPVARTQWVRMISVHIPCSKQQSMAAKLGLKPLADVCRRAATSHAAGLDARTIWKRESESGSPTKRRQFLKISEAIYGGETLADALRSTDGYLPELMCDMVHVGEQSGRVEESLNRLAEYYDQIRVTRNTFLAGIAWPVLQLVVAVILLGVVIWIMGFIQSEDMDLDMLGLGLTGTRGATIYFAIVGAIAVVGMWLARSIARGQLSAFLMGPLMKLPAIGKWFQLEAMSRMAWALGMSVESGMSAGKCAEVSLRSTQNKYFTQHQKTVAHRIRSGDTFYNAFAETGAFSQDFLDAVLVGEETGRIGESMSTLSRQYEQQAKVVMRTMAVVGGICVWLGVAAFIIFFIFRIAFFYYGLLDDIMNGNF